MDEIKKHSNRVVAIRVGLLAIALGLVGALVLSYRGTNEAVLAEFTADDEEFDQAANTVTSPRISVVKENGNSADIEAEAGRQQSDETGFQGDGLKGEFMLNDTQWQLSAERGFAPVGYDRVILTDNVKAVSENGIEIETSAATAFLSENRIVANDAVTVRSKQLEISADSARMDGEDGARVIHFEGGVKGTLFSPQGNLGATSVNDETAQ